jgi:transcriptional regulator GlxA family with amidase domain
LALKTSPQPELWQAAGAARAPAPRNTRLVPTPRTRLRVGIILANRFTLTALSAFVDTLRLAADEGDRSRQILCSWTVMSATGATVRASCGLDVVPQSRFLDPRAFHYVVIVGGLLHGGEQVDAATTAYLVEAAQVGTPLVGLCTGSFILVRAGLMAGRRCCVSWYHRDDFAQEFPDVPFESDQIFSIDGDRITCSGGSGSADLAAALIERHVGEGPSQKAHVVLQMGVPRPATATQPTPSLARRASDPRVRHTAVIMEQNLAAPLSVGELAQRVGVSERQLDRMFKREFGTGPATIYRRMRCEYGHWLLLSTELSVLEVASRAGFVDGGHFTRAFRSQFGTTPSALRHGRSSDAGDALPRTAI